VDLLPNGIAQLSLVEHALCRLDAQVSLTPNSVHEAHYRYTDSQGDAKQATARVFCPLGLSPHDEFFLYGLLSLTFAQKEPTTEFVATPHYCLRHLQCISESDRGGKQYATFREAIRRLSAVVYQNDAFFDPVRGEHRQVSFNFLSYSLPLDPESSRAWRFVWNPLWLELTQAVGGKLAFDLELYQQLDVASRRLFLLLKKIFWRMPVSPFFDVEHLAVEVLGFSPTVSIPNLKIKLLRCVQTLAEHGVLEVPNGVATQAMFRKLSKGRYQIRFRRGRYFAEDSSAGSARRNLLESPLTEPLQTIGLDDATIRRVLRDFKPRLIEEWADITLAAIERKIIKKSPQAFFIDNLQKAVSERRTPPDWWRELRKQEERQREEQARFTPERDQSTNRDHSFEVYLRQEAREIFERTMQRVFDELKSSGQAEPAARENAEYIARMHLHRQFLREHPEHANDE